MHERVVEDRMTRINCVPVSELSDRHLVAEYRELPRVYALSAAALGRGETPNDHPDEYFLGKGHVKFFYSRLGYIRKRQRQLIQEMRRRGFQVNYPEVHDCTAWPRSWRRRWTPDAAALRMNRARIRDRS